MSNAVKKFPWLQKNANTVEQNNRERARIVSAKSPRKNYNIIGKIEYSFKEELDVLEMKVPDWLRALNIVFGLISVILSVVVLVYQEFAILTMIFVLSIVLLVVGFARIFGGIFATYLSDGMRAVEVGIGILALVLGSIALLYSDLTTQVLIYILSFALLLNGIARLVIGGFARAFPRWLRGLLVVVGILTIVLAAFVFLSPKLGFLALVLMLSFTFLFNGIARIAQGIAGTQKTEL